MTVLNPFVPNAPDIYLLKVNNRNTRTRLTKLTIEIKVNNKDTRTFKVNNKDTRTTPASFWYLYC